VAVPVKRAADEKKHRAHMVNRLSRQPVERVKRAPQEKEYKARRLSRSSSGSSNSNSEAARLLQPITARNKGSRKAGRRRPPKKHRRQGHDNSEAIVAAAPEWNFRSCLVVAAFVSNAWRSLRGVFTRTEIDFTEESGRYSNSAI
jgi:hypothetical protein